MELEEAPARLAAEKKRRAATEALAIDRNNASSSTRAGREHDAMMCG